jgi:predicted transcriptional regulator of viral defense system
MQPSLERFLATHPIFRREELEGFLQQRGTFSPATASAHLGRWRRQGRVLRVKQGLYVQVDPGATPDTQPVDHLVLASKMAPDAALAYHTALEAHGLAQSVFERFAFATWTKSRPLRFQGREFVPVRPRVALKRARKEHAWIERLDRAGAEVSVTSLERTVVDVFDRPDLCGGTEEVWRSCMSVPALDARELESYLRLLGAQTLVAKVAYFLERQADELAVPRAMLTRLQALRPRVPVYVDRRARGRLISRWNLIVPEHWLPEGEGAAT